jgi:hypothetical protein
MDIRELNIGLMLVIQEKPRERDSENIQPTASRLISKKIYGERLT